MRKACPHCHEDTFGWRELITLNCFTSEQCKSCDKLVRNSGWRQSLVPFAILSIILAALRLSELIPSEKSMLLIPVAVIAMPLALVLIAKPVKADASQTDRAPFTPNPENDKVILIQGWDEDEISQILNDFVGADLRAFVAFRI